MEKGPSTYAEYWTSPYSEVKELTNKTIYFKLYGKFGQIVSKLFKLT